MQLLILLSGWIWLNVIRPVGLAAMIITVVVINRWKKTEGKNIIFLFSICLASMKVFSFSKFKNNDHCHLFTVDHCYLNTDTSIGHCVDQ